MALPQDNSKGSTPRDPTRDSLANIRGHHNRLERLEAAGMKERKIERRRDIEYFGCSFLLVPVSAAHTCWEISQILQLHLEVIRKYKPICVIMQPVQAHLQLFWLTGTGGSALSFWHVTTGYAIHVQAYTAFFKPLFVCRILEASYVNLAFMISQKSIVQFLSIRCNLSWGLISSLHLTSPFQLTRQ